MNYFKLQNLLNTLLIVFFLSSVINAQAKIDAFQIRNSKLFNEIVNIKLQNPKISPNELAERANTLLQKDGINFVFAFDQPTCQKILTAQQKQKDKSQSLKINAQLKSVDAEPANVALPDISFDQSECGRCFVQLPVFEFAGKDFITSVQETNIKFFTPPNFIFNEVSLFDNKNPLAVVRKWYVPFRAVPLGVSDDDKLLYLDLPNKELNDLALVIFDNGGFQIYPKSDLDLTAKSAKPSVIPTELVSPNTAFINFTKADKIQTLKYNTACQ